VKRQYVEVLIYYYKLNDTVLGLRWADPQRNVLHNFTVDELLKFLLKDLEKLILTMLLEQYRGGGNSALVEQENDNIKETKFLT
jgi:hypothetical protein